MQPDLAPAHYGKGISIIAKEEAEFLVTHEQLDQELAEDDLNFDRVAYEGAIASFRKATELDPDFEPAWREQAKLLEELAKNSEALAAYDKAIALNPQNDQLHYYRGSILSRIGRPTEAIEAYTKAIAIKPNGLYYMTRGNSYALLGDFQKFKADLKRAKEIDPEQFGNLPD